MEKRPPDLWALVRLVLGFVECDLYEAGQNQLSMPARQQLEQQAHRFWSHILIASSLIGQVHRVKARSGCHRGPAERAGRLVGFGQRHLVAHVRATQPEDYVLRDIGRVVA